MRTNDKTPPVRLEVYKDKAGKWRWRLISKANIMADSSQGYSSKQGCIIAMNRVKDILRTAPVIDLEAK